MENTLPQQEPDRTFDRIFHPRAVGVIGVSTKETDSAAASSIRSRP